MLIYTYKLISKIQYRKTKQVLKKSIKFFQENTGDYMYNLGTGECFLMLGRRETYWII